MAHILTQEELEIISKLRKDFFQKYQLNIESNEYDIRDLNRLKDSNNWLYTFYRHNHKKYDSALNLIPEVLKWRNEAKANDFLKDSDLPFSEELFKKGAMFLKNCDKNGIPLLHFVVRTHKKDQHPFDEVCKFIAYHFEKYYKFDWNAQIILFFDMSDAGLSNLDMEMIKFVISCLKVYYPGLINYMLIYQMPFIFNAAWKIIKNWLPPEAVQIIKFVDKKSIKEYIDEHQLFTHMGGSDNYQYKYDSNNHKNDIKRESDDLIKKRVCFASTDISLSQSENLSNKSFVKIQSEINEEKNEKIIETNENIKQHINEENKKPSLSLNPNNEIIFMINEIKTDVYQNIILTNNSDNYLAYKIKITSPDKFRVKPGSGVIDPFSKIQITISFLKEHQNVTAHNRDKFLILWTEIEDKTTMNDLPDIWKHQNKSQIHEHKLKCVITQNIEENKQLNPNEFSNQSNLSLFSNCNSSNNENKILQNDYCNINNIIKLEIQELKKNVTEMNKLQHKLYQKYSFLLFLIYFLLFLNLIQLLFQSNFYTYIMEPYIDSIFFSSYNS